MTAAKARKPKGGADVCLAVAGSTPNTTLMQQALTRENLQRAWEQVRANRGAPGIDGMTVEQFPDFVRSPQWISVRKALEDGTYQPQPVRRVYIPKDGGGQRPLGIPPVLDRVIEQALAQVMEPLFDPEFKVSDRQVLRLIWRYLRAGVMENGQWKATEQGVPQGGPLSPLLANIVLHDLDMELEKRGHKFVRYADDSAPRRRERRYMLKAA